MRKALAIEVVATKHQEISLQMIERSTRPGPQLDPFVVAGAVSGLHWRALSALVKWQLHPGTLDRLALQLVEMTAHLPDDGLEWEMASCVHVALHGTRKWNGYRGLRDEDGLLQPGAPQCLLGSAVYTVPMEGRHSYLQGGGHNLAYVVEHYGHWPPESTGPESTGPVEVLVLIQLARHPSITPIGTRPDWKQTNTCQSTGLSHPIGGESMTSSWVWAQQDGRLIGIAGTAEFRPVPSLPIAVELLLGRCELSRLAVVVPRQSARADELEALLRQVRSDAPPEGARIAHLCTVLQDASGVEACLARPDLMRLCQEWVGPWHAERTRRWHDMPPERRFLMASRAACHNSTRLASLLNYVLRPQAGDGKVSVSLRIQGIPGLDRGVLNELFKLGPGPEVGPPAAPVACDVPTQWNRAQAAADRRRARHGVDLFPWVGPASPFVTQLLSGDMDTALRTAATAPRAGVLRTPDERIWLTSAVLSLVVDGRGRPLHHDLIDALLLPSHSICLAPMLTSGVSSRFASRLGPALVTMRDRCLAAPLAECLDLWHRLVRLTWYLCGSDQCLAPGVGLTSRRRSSRHSESVVDALAQHPDLLCPPGGTPSGFGDMTLCLMTLDFCTPPQLTADNSEDCVYSMLTVARAALRLCREMQGHPDWTEAATEDTIPVAMSLVSICTTLRQSLSVTAEAPVSYLQPTGMQEQVHEIRRACATLSQIAVQKCARALRLMCHWSRARVDLAPEFSPNSITPLELRLVGLQSIVNCAQWNCVDALTFEDEPQAHVTALIEWPVVIQGMSFGSVAAIRRSLLVVTALMEMQPSVNLPEMGAVLAKLMDRAAGATRTDTRDLTRLMLVRILGTRVLERDGVACNPLGFPIHRLIELFSSTPAPFIGDGRDHWGECGRAGAAMDTYMRQTSQSVTSPLKRLREE